MLRRILGVLFVALAASVFSVAQPPAPSASALRPAPAHPAFKVAVYIAVSDVERMKDPAYLEKAWGVINSQVHVDKVYIESYRSGVLADGALLETVKAWFKAHGVETAGGIAFTAGGDMAGPEAAGGQFVSFTYTDPKQREYVKHVAEETARHFDEIILDDFFFNDTKRDSDIAAKGMQTWSAFRLKLMDEVARDLVYGAAKRVNPKVKVIIKFPNWYEHFQANGYDLAQEPKIFDGIYTGTETRDGEITDQHLQQYESYEVVRYFDNVAPGRNGGGWVDTFDTRYIDRYAEQLWNTMLAKAPEIMLFEWNNLTQSARLGTRPWSSLDTTFTEVGLDKWHADSGSTQPVTWGTAAGYALDAANAVIPKLGKPIGIASYKPYQSTGEDFLHNFLGMIGIPIDLEPSFPVNAKTVLLTESARYDPTIVAKIKAHLQQGGNVVITSGLLKALEGRGIEQIAEIRSTGNVLNVDRYWGAFGAGAGANLGTTEAVQFPEIGFMTNDAWPVVRGTANGRGAPLVLMDRFSKGTFYVLTIPENFNDLYRLPQGVLAQIRRYVMGDFPVSIDAPGKVSLFAYDNGTFVVESYRDEPVKVTVNAAGTFAHIRNLASGAEVDGSAVAQWRGRPTTPRTTFQIEVPPHSFVAFAEEK
jgi:hypothetical protein